MNTLVVQLNEPLKKLFCFDFVSNLSRQISQIRDVGGIQLPQFATGCNGAFVGLNCGLFIVLIKVKVLSHLNVCLRQQGELLLRSDSKLDFAQLGFVVQ